MQKRRRQNVQRKAPTGKRTTWLVVGIVAVALGMGGVLWIATRPPVLGVEAILAVFDEGEQYGGLTISYPLDETLFPPEIAPATFRWQDNRQGSDDWLVTIQFPDGAGRMSSLVSACQWEPSDEEWDQIKRRSLKGNATVTVLGVSCDGPVKINSGAGISIGTSGDEAGAPLFYREVNLPFRDAVKDPSRIRWRFGEISSQERPPIVLEKLPVCGNCHSFSDSGEVLGMDVDYANDKGSYVITPVSKEIVLQSSQIITWSDCEREDDEPTFGLLSQVSPNGRYVVSTVKDRAVFVATDDLAFSQLFFPVKGILAVYDRQSKQFSALPGADDPELVQSNPTWSPDGKEIVFARAKAMRLESLEVKERVLLAREECREFLDEGKPFIFDLYRIPFDDGKGGKAEPLEGASHNGMSNYFPKYSPDGKWIVFCKAKNYMLLQPDSELYIVPAGGGDARRMRCNTGRMNSWHSWSPNGKWLVFSSKANSAYTQLFLTHLDEQGNSSPPVLLERFTAQDRAANIPEFVNLQVGAIRKMSEQFIDDYSHVRAGKESYRGGDLGNSVAAFRKALQINPDNLDANFFLAEILLIQGKLDEAEVATHKWIELDPDDANGYRNLGIIARRRQNLPEALKYFREALRIAPESAQGHLCLGGLLLESGSLKEAKVHLLEAARLDPSDHMAHFSLAQVFEGEGDLESAVLHLTRSLEQEPQFLPTILTLASIRAMSADAGLRNGEQAVRLATAACELTGYESAEALDALGAAHAEVGRFSDAVSVAQAALRISHATGNRALANEIQLRLEHYRRREPLRR